MQASTEDFPNTGEKIEKEYERVTKEKPEFLRKDGKPVRSWARRDVDMMLASIGKEKVLPKEQLRSLAKIYVNGCRKTHFNPIELLSYMEQATWDRSSQDSRTLALLVSSSSLVRLTTRYIDLISKINDKDTYHDIGDKATTFLDELNKVDSLSA